MWTRKELKTRAKEVLHFNYWKLVLVGLILSFALSGSINIMENNGFKTVYKQVLYDDNNGFSISSDSNEFNQIWNEYHLEDKIDSFTNNSTLGVGTVVLAVCVFIVVMLIVAAVYLAVRALLLNPLLVGTRRFFNRSFEEKANVREVTFGFDYNYKNVAKVMFFKTLYTFLWTLLFIIPGIVKSYEYSMIPYLLSEYPDMDMEQAFATSKQMMTGNKWKKFVLDLSFIGWMILSGITAGIVGVLFVTPYAALTEAALYRRLRGYDQPVGSSADVEESDMPSSNDRYGYMMDNINESNDDQL